MPKEKKWILKDTADRETVSRHASELGVDPVLALLLVQRGVNTFREARDFFRPDLGNLHDPFLMKDMDKAVERIRQAIGKGEKILVYGDYDVDGTTAVSLVYSFLRRLTPHVDFYIPDRYDEGYGVSFKGIDWAAENGFSLIITLDCGIKAVEEVEYARQKFACDFVHIRDHQQQTLRSGISSSQCTSLKRAVNCTGSTSFRLHFLYQNSFAEDVLATCGSPFVYVLSHGRRRSDGVDGCYFRKHVRDVSGSFVAITSDEFFLFSHTITKLGIK